TTCSTISAFSRCWCATRTCSRWRRTSSRPRWREEHTTTARPSCRAIGPIRYSPADDAGSEGPGLQQSPLQRMIREHHRPPHVRHGAAVEAEPFLWLLEVAPDDVDEGIERHLHVGLEGVQIVDRDHARFHVPLVVARVVVGLLDVGLGDVVLAEDAD